MAFWNKKPDPQLAEEVTGNTRHPYTPKSEGGILGWGLTYDQIKKGRPDDFARRAAYFAMPFNAATREDFANSVGLLSKSQKQAVKGAGMFTRAMHAAIPISTILGVGAYALDGNTTGYISDIAAPGIGMFTGYRLGNSIGMTMASTITKSGGKRLGAALAAGAVGGATGGLLAYAAAETLVTAGDSNNRIKKWYSDWKGAEFQQDVMMTQSTMTNRRRAMEELSKSYLNNRGQVLGNEAQIARGIL